MKQSHVTCALALMLALGAGCHKPKAVRGSDTPGLDYAAMGTGLDRRDLSQMARENLDAMKNSRVMQVWSSENRPPISVLPIRNETSEHIDSALGALISEVETYMINNAPVRVISMEQQGNLIAEIRKQYSGAFDASQISTWGKQIGARYVVTGKVFTSDERQDGERRVQYFMFIQVLSIETGEILFQHKTSVTKALI